jgi:hypothetical protein
MQNFKQPKISALDPVPDSLDDFHRLEIANRSRNWALGAIAEMVDSAISRSKDDVQIDFCNIEGIRGVASTLTVTDNGPGLTSAEIRSLCSLGETSGSHCSQRGCAGGFLRIAKDALILSKIDLGDRSEAHVALLSLSQAVPDSTRGGAMRHMLPFVRMDTTGFVFAGGEAGAWLVGQRIKASISHLLDIIPVGTVLASIHYQHTTNQSSYSLSHSNTQSRRNPEFVHS